MIEGYIKYIEPVDSIGKSGFNMIINLSKTEYKLILIPEELVNIIRKFRPYLVENEIIIDGDLKEQSLFVEEILRIFNKAGLKVVMKKEVEE